MTDPIILQRDTLIEIIKDCVHEALMRREGCIVIFEKDDYESFNEIIDEYIT